MENIINFLSDDCKEWFSKQSNETIANIIQNYFNNSVSKNDIFTSKNNNFVSKTLNTEVELEDNQFAETEVVRYIPKTIASAHIGQTGEDYIKKLLDKTGLWIIEDIKTKSKSGDIRCKPHYDLLSPLYSLSVEVKKYNTTIPYAQVEKFYRDLSNNNEYSMGLFISICKPIARIPTKFYHETKLINGQYRFLIFLNLDGMYDEKIIKIASEILIFQSCNYIKINQSHITQLNQILFNINKFNDLKINLVNLKTITNNNINEMERMIDSIYSEMESSINVIKLDMPVLNNKIIFDNKDIMFEKLSLPEIVKRFINSFETKYNSGITYSKNKNIESIEFYNIAVQISFDEINIITNDSYITEQPNYTNYNKKNKCVTYNINDWKF